MKSMKRLPLLAGLFAGCLAWAAGPADPATSLSLDRNGDGRPDQWYEVVDGRLASLAVDRNYDDLVDFATEFGPDEQTVDEALDFNYDGRMDDFYYFEDGKLVRQEIDTNYDDRVDVWVYLEGPNIRRYEMDKDFDGVAEVKQDYGP